MSAHLDAVCGVRADVISRSLARHRLVFVQLGAAFEPLRQGILDRLNGCLVDVGQLNEWDTVAAESHTLVVRDLDRCIGPPGLSLGSVREKVFELLDANKAVCLVSRSPRLSFASVAGSSVLEDAALVSLSLLEQSELKLQAEEWPAPGWKWPSVTFGEPLDQSTYLRALAELGQGLIAALDHALFEVNPKGLDGLQFLSSREVEGLRGGGILELDGEGSPHITDLGSVKLLREAVAAHISETVIPADILPSVTSGLWFIERKLRSAARRAAIEKFGMNWRASAVGGLDGEILRRAQLDTNVTAKSVTDLRDPLEWLTLGELLDAIRSPKFEHLGIEPAIWRKLQEQLVPIRNRLAHVRMLKSGDDETVAMWMSLIRSRFGD